MGNIFDMKQGRENGNRREREMRVCRGLFAISVGSFWSVGFGFFFLAERFVRKNIEDRWCGFFSRVHGTVWAIENQFLRGIKGLGKLNFNSRLWLGFGSLRNLSLDLLGFSCCVFH